MVRLKRLLVKSLGITRLNMVFGPLMGGLQSFMWARHYPEMVGAAVSVFATPAMRPMGLMVPNQLGIEAIRLDPKWNKGDYSGKEPPNDGLLSDKIIKPDRPWQSMQKCQLGMLCTKRTLRRGPCVNWRYHLK